MKKLLLSAAVLAMGINANAAMESTTFPALDVFKAHKEDVANEKLGNAPRFAIVHDVNIDVMNKSNWEKQGNTLVWKHRIFADRAVSINLAFEEFQLSQGAELEIYSLDQKRSVRAFTANDNNKAMELWTPVIESQELIVEFRVPANEFSQNRLVLTKVNQGYRTFTQTTQKAGSCNVDVACSESTGWEAEVNSVAVISTGGSTFCTGFMVNNAKNDGTPFFMTANHCRIRSYNASSLVAYWNYQASACGGARDGSKTEFTSGSEFLAANANSDFALVKLNSRPDDSYGVRYAGWDRSGAIATQATAIHHPSTDEKSISFEYQPTTHTKYLKEAEVADATHVRVEDWDVGTTEPGSSGSPLFDQNHRVIGQLHGGYASCSSQTSDWYGRFSVSWDFGSTKDTRLKDHLDPENTGVMTVDTL